MYNRRKSRQYNYIVTEGKYCILFYARLIGVATDNSIVLAAKYDIIIYSIMIGIQMLL